LTFGDQSSMGATWSPASWNGGSTSSRDLGVAPADLLIGRVRHDPVEPRSEGQSRRSIFGRSTGRPARPRHPRVAGHANRQTVDSTAVGVQKLGRAGIPRRGCSRARYRDRWPCERQGISTISSVEQSVPRRGSAASPFHVPPSRNRLGLDVPQTKFARRMFLPDVGRDRIDPPLVGIDSVDRRVIDRDLAASRFRDVDQPDGRVVRSPNYSGPGARGRLR
jgi:hypothetical protein